MSDEKVILFSEYEGQAWLGLVKGAIECTPHEFKQLWAAKPDIRHTIKIFNREVPIPRYQAIWGRDYGFSGKVLQRSSTEMPELVQTCINFAKEQSPEFEWNAALVNWYPDGASYISAHSDDERELVKEAPIYSFNFGGIRKFRIRDKENKIKCDVETLHGSVITMGGPLFQSVFKHEIVKTKKKVDPRVNVTVRSFT